MYTTWSYCDVTEKLHGSWNGVERNIRTARDYSWENGGKEELKKLAGDVLDEKPAVSEAIKIMVCYLKKHGELLKYNMVKGDSW